MKHRSLLLQIILPTLSLVIIGFIAIGSYMIWSQASHQMSMFENKATLSGNMARAGVIHGLREFNDQILANTIDPIKRDPTFKSAVVVTAEGKEHFHVGEGIEHDTALIAAIENIGREHDHVEVDDLHREYVGNMLIVITPLQYSEGDSHTFMGGLVLVFDTSTVTADILKTTLTSIAMMIAALGLIGVAIFAVTRSITRPLAGLQLAMTAISAGQLDVEIDNADRRDEVGSMARAVQVFKDNAIAKISLEDEAEQGRVSSTQDREKQQRLERERADAVDNSLAEALQSLAQGDLTVQITEEFASDYEGLRKDFNTSVSQLAKTMRSVVQNTGSITNGAQEIANGTNDLSKRTEQQAAALEETAAALDEITSNVTNSTNRADEARQVANNANRSAEESGEVVAQAVNAMSRIEDSSRKISNIIGVIDEIAFQTNLLALNAGVEAARAGEAGRGFAVVAQEVRELAGRSAGAAKEIKELISTSTNEVASGVELVSQAGEALKSIGELVVSINSHMDAIATSAREQSTGLVEVNGAVIDMDQATQKNAAMVEESSAAAATLADNSLALRKLVENFNLEANSTQVAALRKVSNTMAAPLEENTEPVKTAISGKPAPIVQGNVAVDEQWDEF